MMQQTNNIEILAEQQERELPKFLRSWWPLTYSSVSQFGVERQQLAVQHKKLQQRTKSS